MKHLTIRRVPPEVAQALDQECRRRRKSLNQTVLDLLERALGLGRDPRFSNGLRDLAGDWSAEEFDEFEKATREFEDIDEGVWR